MHQPLIFSVTLLDEIVPEQAELWIKKIVFNLERITYKWQKLHHSDRSLPCLCLYMRMFLYLEGEQMSPNVYFLL